MKLYFDTETGELITEAQLLEQYPDWVKERISEEGAEYVLQNMQDFSFEQFVENCTTPWNGTLIPVMNAEHYIIKEAE